MHSLPQVRYEEDTGSNLTHPFSVCPIPDCIKMVPKQIPHVIKRGIPPKNGVADNGASTTKIANGRVVLMTN